MLFLPLEEDSIVFRLCLYYGVIVVILELIIPLLFHRRVRIKIPHMALHAPGVPLSSHEFQQRRLVLQQQITALQRALAETPVESPQKKKQCSSVDTTKNGLVASPLSSMASPTSSLTVTRPSSSRKRSNGRIAISRSPLAADSLHTSMPSPMAMCDFLAIRTVPRGGFSFHKVFEEEESGEEKQDEILQEEQDNRMEAVNRRTMRRRESPTFSRRRPVRFVLEDADKAGYLGVSLKPNEAATRFETLIGARRRQRASTLQMHVSAAPALDRVPLSAAAAPATRVKNVLEHSASNESGTAASEELLRPQDKNKVMEEDEERRELEQSGVSSPSRQQVGRDALEEDEGRKRPATNEPLTDFQAFCASFAAGGSAAAHRAMAKRKQYGAVNKQADSSATALHQIFDRLKHPRTVGQEMKQPNGDDTAVTPRSANKRSHYEAFGFDETEMTDNAVATRQVLQKSKNEQVSGMTNNQEEPEKKTPQIARRISFDNEVDALVDTPSKGVSGRLSNRKRKRTQAFGMSDEDDKDTEWRDSLTFRPHRFRQAD